jgi:hypothetical protein
MARNLRHWTGEIETPSFKLQTPEKLQAPSLKSTGEAKGVWNLVLEASLKFEV